MRGLPGHGKEAKVVSRGSVAGRGVLERFQNKSITSTMKQLCEVTTLFKLMVS